MQWSILHREIFVDAAGERRMEKKLMALAYVTELSPQGLVGRERPTGRKDTHDTEQCTHISSLLPP